MDRDGGENTSCKGDSANLGYMSTLPGLEPILNAVQALLESLLRIVDGAYFYPLVAEWETALLNPKLVGNLSCEIRVVFREKDFGFNKVDILPNEIMVLVQDFVDVGTCFSFST